MISMRQLLFHAGAKLPSVAARQLLAASSCLELGSWMSDSGFRCRHFYNSRKELFAAVAAEVGSRQALYLEFGVYTGESMRMWAELLKNPRSILHGFDSFEGLPDDWNDGGFKKGHFDTNGHLPHIDDSRVTFFKGWFDQTLPSYSLPDREILIMNIDADLYSSTSLVLKTLESHIRQGDFLYFDEFCVPLDEPRAFRELLARSSMMFSVFGATKGYRGVVFRCDNV